jgi:serine protease Do
MKKFIYQVVSASLFCLVFGQLTRAQSAVVPPPPPPSNDMNDKSDQQEIIIRQKGAKDAKITLEIKNGEYFINGKPLEKFDDQNIIVEKRDIDENIVAIPDIVYSPSPFRDENWNKDNNERALRNMERAMSDADRQRRIQKSIQIRMNSAFLGVSSKKAEKGGATVLEVTPGSPAEKAGIKKGDVITKVNETKIESPESLFETIHSLKAGDKVKVSFMRDGKEQTVTATLDKSNNNERDFNYNYNFKMPPMPDVDGIYMGPWGHQPKLGIKAQDAEDGKGVNILEVEDSSAAAKAGLKKGDIILQFDGAEVNSTNELIEELQAARGKATLKVRILRGGVSQEMEIRIPRKLKTAEL